MDFAADLIIVTSPGQTTRASTNTRHLIAADPSSKLSVRHGHGLVRCRTALQTQLGIVIQHCLVQVGNGIELEAVGLQFEPTCGALVV